MATQQIRGSTQIMAGTVPLTALVAGYSIPTANLAQGALFVQSNGTVAMTAALNMGTNLINNVSTPVASTDAANKAYVDALANGLQLRFVRLVSNANIVVTTGGLLTVDGVVTVAGNIVLLTNQTTASQNGPWVVAAGAWTRPTYWASGAVEPEGNYFISDAEGTSYSNSKWFVTNTGSITVDTTAVTFSRDLSGTTVTAGNGISVAVAGLTSTVSVNAGNGISAAAAALTAVGDATNLISVTASGIGVTPSTTAAQFVVANASKNATWVAMSGDVTISSAGAATVSTSTTTGFLKYSHVIANEVVGGTPNGLLTTFTTANAPVQLQLYLNGLLQRPTTDYTLSGSTVTMTAAPTTGDNLYACYVY